MSSSDIILIIDDDADLRDTLSDILKLVGYETRQAKHGLDALEQLAAGLRPSLILLDLLMPVMNGWEFREVQLQDPRFATTPVVVFTVAQNRERPIAVRDVILKPFALDRLIATLDELLPSDQRAGARS